MMKPNENGVIVHNYILPIPHIAKKVLYHFSDIHLTESDALSATEEVRRAADQTEHWETTRKDFALQYGEPYETVQKKSAAAHLKALLQVAQSGDAFVMAGDISDYNAEANFRTIERCLAEVTTPFLAVSGNHEEAEAIADTYRYSAIKQPVQTLDLGDLVVCGVHNAQRCITAAQNAEIEALLQGEKPVIFLMHVPIMTDGNRELLTQSGPYFQLNHAEASAETLSFIEILNTYADHIVAVLCGHLHFLNESEIVPGLTQYVSSQGILGHINRYEIGV